MGRPCVCACNRRVYSNVTGNVYRRRLPRRSLGRVVRGSAEGRRRVKRRGGGGRRAVAACGWAVGCTRDLLSRTRARERRETTAKRWRRRRRADWRNSAAQHSAGLVAAAAAAAARDPHDTIIMRVVGAHAKFYRRVFLISRFVRFRGKTCRGVMRIYV